MISRLRPPCSGSHPCLPGKPCLCIREPVHLLTRHFCVCSFNPFRDEDKHLRKVGRLPQTPNAGRLELTRTLLPPSPSDPPWSCQSYVQTSIVGTIGPSIDSVAKVSALMEAGMSIGQSQDVELTRPSPSPPSLTYPAAPVRINFSHGTHETHQNEIDMIREAVNGESVDRILVPTAVDGPSSCTLTTVATLDTQPTPRAARWRSQSTPKAQGSEEDG